MFYNEISSYYDQMIPFEKRLAGLQEQLAPLVRKYKITSALDIGSATGATCIALSQLGVQSAGLESAALMVKLARQRCREYNQKIFFKQADMLNRGAIDRKVEAIFILANTVSHLLNKRDLNRLLTNFRSWLEPGGLVVIQLLNYKRILSERERIVKIYNNQERTFVRFYDFGKKVISFNLLTVENRPGVCNFQLSSIPIRGWQPDEIKSALEKRKFVKIRQYGSLKGDRFIPSKSNDIVLICQKNR